jgi:glutamate-1-semialdehyde aminotransferase
MECMRCQGLMVEDHFFDFEGTQGFMWVKGWRCMNCGHAADPVTEANHRLHEATVHARPSENPEHEHEHVSLRAEPITRVAA